MDASRLGFRRQLLSKLESWVSFPRVSFSVLPGPIGLPLITDNRTRWASMRSVLFYPNQMPAFLLGGYMWL